MNGESFFRSTIGAMISHGFAVDDVRTKLFLKGASEVWGGEELDAHPAWYFWLDNRPGAFRLQLVNCGRVDELAGSVIRGIFTVKYYPSPSEPVFRHFSNLEQALILGAAFDQTNTPKLAGQVPGNLFNVGSIEFFRDLEKKQSFLLYTSLDQFNFHPVASAKNTFEKQELTVADAPKARQIPAWDLGYPLFDMSVGLHSFLTRESPKRIILSHQGGFEFFESSTGCLLQQNSSSTTFKSLLVAFRPESGDGDEVAEQSVISLMLGSSWKSIYDASFQGCPVHRHPHGDNDRILISNRHETETCVDDDDHRHVQEVYSTTCLNVADCGILSEGQLVLNEQWWLMANAEQFMKSMCGCH